MLMRSLAPALLAFGASVVSAESFGDLASCGQTCINNMDTSTGCVPVTSECLCSNSNFLYGIRDCANSACSASDASAAYSYASSSCASVLSATATTAAATTSPAETTTSEAPATTSEAAETTSSTSVPNNDAQTTSSGTTAAAAAQTSSEASSTTADSSASSTQSAVSGEATSTASSTNSGSSSATSGGAAAGASSTSSASGKSSSNVTNLSTGAKAGIVVGSAVGAVAIVAAVLYLSRKRQAPLPRGNLKISEPLPGSGRIDDEVWEQYHTPSPPYSPQYQRQFTPTKPGTAYSNMSELDRHARPYEEMVPRTTPARMV